jgi:hypothetical protein
VEVSAWETVFVRARRRDVHPVLADVAGYGAWWPGAWAAPHGGAVRLTLRPPTAAARLCARTHALDVTVAKRRRDLGVDLVYRGTLTGTAEWYYLDEAAGVTVHYLVHARVAAAGWRRTLAEHRACVRAALNELKDRLEGGRAVGAEPERALLDDQRQAAAAFRAGVEAWARRAAAQRAPA